MSYTLFAKYGYARVYTLDPALHGGIASRFARSGMDIDADGAPKAYAPTGSGLKALDILSDGGWPNEWYAGPKGEDGKWIIQGQDDPAPGYIVSSTAWNKGPMNRQASYVPADKVPYWVVPEQSDLLTHLAPLGTLGLAYNLSRGIYSGFVVADEGPKTHFGEGSIALASMLGVNPSPVSGGVTSGIITLFFLGQTLEFGDWDSIHSKAGDLFVTWGGIPKMKEVVQTLFS